MQNKMMNQNISINWFSPKTQQQERDLGSQNKPPLFPNPNTLSKFVGQKHQRPSGRFLY